MAANAKIPFLVLLLLILMFFCVASAAAKAKTRKEKVSRLKFYFHDTVMGKNRSAVIAVAPAKGFLNSFGLISVMDDPLTLGPTMDSPQVGSAQGIYSSTCSTVQGGVRLLMAMNLVFNSGEYNGSTLALLGSNAVLSEVREMPIVGGTGLFRFARGYAQLRSRVLEGGNAVVRYDVTVMHF